MSVYNGADLMAQALETVYAQTYRDFDVLVLDDGSKDNSSEIARQFPCQLITIPNGGRGAAIRRMVEEATGEFVALIDHDDFWLPDKLEKQVALLDSTGATLVHADCWYNYSDGRSVERNLNFSTDACAFDHILPSNEVIASSAVFRRQDMLDAGNFVSDTLRCVDWYGWLILAPHRKFAHVPEKLVRYSVLDTSLANAGYRFFEAQYYLLAEKMLPRTDELFEGLPKSQATKYRAMMVERSGIALSSMARAMEITGDKKQARVLHRRAIQMAPRVPRVWTRALKSLFT